MDSLRTEQAFDEYVRRARAGETIEPEDFVAVQPEEVQSGLRRLLALYDQLRDRLDAGMHAPKPGQSVASYRLIRELGRGGMGVVWEAEQVPLGRRVALKLLPPAFGQSPARIERFRREAAAGGRLTHPGIVAVYDLGEAGGAWYLATELVGNGRNLADEILSWRQHPDLPADHYEELAQRFAGLADALHALHEAGVIHRDLKPANILVTGEGQWKLCDFGLAHLDGALSMTASRDYAGTPFYMSPEHVQNAAAVDRRSDVFSLGATLYEALTHVRPFRGETSNRVIESILRDEPLEPHRLASGVPAELSWICLKALEKSPARRYANAAALADDLRRFHRREPISAGRAGWLRRAGKWFRRHPVIGASGSVALLAIGGLSWLAFEYRASRDEAVRQVQIKDGVSRFLVDLFTQVSPSADAAHQMSARDLLRVGGGRLSAADAAGAPEVRAGLLDAVGRSYLALGDCAAAAPLLEEALAVRRAVRGPFHRETIQSEAAVGELRFAQQDFPAARDRLQRAYDLARRHLPADDFEIYRYQSALGEALFALGDAPAALRHCEEAYERTIALPEAGPTHVVRRQSALAQALSRTGREADALAMAAEALERARAQLGENEPLTLRVWLQYASSLQEAGDFSGSDREFLRLARSAASTYGPAHPFTLYVQQRAAGAAFLNGRGQEAEGDLRRVIAEQERVLPAAHLDILKSKKLLGGMLANRGEFEQALEFLRLARDGMEASLGPEHPETSFTSLALAGLYYQSGRQAEAARACEVVLDRLADSASVDRHFWAKTAALLALIYVAQERHGEALPLVAETLPHFRQESGADGLKAAEAVALLSRCRWYAGDPEAAVALLVEEFQDAAARRALAGSEFALAFRQLTGTVDSDVTPVQRAYRGGIGGLLPAEPEFFVQAAEALLRAPQAELAAFAAGASRRALDLAPAGPQPALWDLHARALLRAGDPEGALAAAEAALAQAGDEGKAEYEAKLQVLRGEIERVADAE